MNEFIQSTIVLVVVVAI